MFDSIRCEKYNDMHKPIVATVLLLSIISMPAMALSLSDPLTAWRNGSTMDRLHLATRFGKSFITLDESFTTDYFIKCIDDVSVYDKARDARIEDAMRECVAARLRQSGSTDD